MWVLGLPFFMENTVVFTDSQMVGVSDVAVRATISYTKHVVWCGVAVFLACAVVWLVVDLVKLFAHRKH